MTEFIMDSPVGPLALREEDGVLAELRFGGIPTKGAAPMVFLRQVQEQLEAYFAGQLREFKLPIILGGTDFQHAVWEALREIPYGTTCTYGDIAKKIGRPNAVRAVGHAIGQNPISIIVPCHRVIGKNGTLTGFAGGLAVKAQLLEIENSI